MYLDKTCPVCDHKTVKADPAADGYKCDQCGAAWRDRKPLSMRHCPQCDTPTGSPDWKARSHILWANQYGEKIRIFCDQCGAWSDLTYSNEKKEVVRHRTVKKAKIYLQSGTVITGFDESF